MMYLALGASMLCVMMLFGLVYAWLMSMGSDAKTHWVRYLIGISVSMLLILLGGFSMTVSIVILSVGLMLAGWLPKIFKNYRRQKRLYHFERQLPAALFLLASSLRAGVALTTSWRQVTESAEAPLAQEFGLMLKEQRLGLSWESVLGHFERRVPSEMAVLLAATLRIGLASGGNLADALERIGQTIQARVQWQAKLQALTAQGRMQAWIVGALPLCLLFVLTYLEPSLMSPLWQTPLGWAVLGSVLVLEWVGVWMIRRTLRIDF